MKYTLLAILALTFFACKQPSATQKQTFAKYESKVNFSFERYFIRAAKCEIRDSSYVLEKSLKLENVLKKVEEKALSSKANWVVITGLGEGAVKDHYFFESYFCEKAKHEKVVSSLMSAQKREKIVDAPADQALASRNYDNFKNVIRSRVMK